MLGRWANLLQALYSAGEPCIKKEPEFFANLVDILITQYKLLPDQLFQEENRILNKVAYLIEDMIDTELEELAKKARELKTYLASRGMEL